MKVIIAGSRTITDYGAVVKAVADSGFDITEVVCGKARGVDTLGEEWANKNDIPVKPFPAEWNKFGKPAGLIRNIKMAEYADALIAITAGSPGTAHTIMAMGVKSKSVFVMRYRAGWMRKDQTL